GVVLRPSHLPEGQGKSHRKGEQREQESHSLSILPDSRGSETSAWSLVRWGVKLGRAACAQAFRG
ncbi:MAG: hypothetical protein VB934_04905, partial [Polyangiaceae bacterium]